MPLQTTYPRYEQDLLQARFTIPLRLHSLVTFPALPGFFSFLLILSLYFFFCFLYFICQGALETRGSATTGVDEP